MIKIVKGPTKHGRRRFACSNCGTVFIADKWNYELSDMAGEWKYRLPCPTCGLREWIPYTSVKIIMDDEIED